MIDINFSQMWTKNTPEPPLNETINDSYETKTKLQEPTQDAYIYLGNKVNDNNMKVLKFIKMKEETLNRIKNEIELMQFVKHPNILKIEDCFIFKEYVCIVTPYCPLSNLHDFIINNYPSGMPNKMAAHITYQLFEALRYLHNLNIWHRDIKPENILVINDDEKNPNVVLADFGFAKKIEEETYNKEFLGTPEFTAPEMFKLEQYTNKVDIYSLGVTLFVMLTARYPTCSYANNPRKCRWLIENGILNYKLLEDMKIYPDAIDLVKKMCAFDQDDRITAEDALNHQWILNNNSTANEINNIQNYDEAISI